MAITRAEAEASLASLSSDIEGMRALSAVTMSDPALVAVRQIRDRLLERQRMYQTLLTLFTQLDAADVALIADGHPAVPEISVAPEVFDEILAKLESLAGTADNFTPRASVVTVTVGNPVPK